MPQGDTVFFPMTDYWMGRLVDGRRVEVRARTAHWATGVEKADPPVLF